MDAATPPADRPLAPVPQRYLLVVLAPDLAEHMTTFQGVWAGIITRAGVTEVGDLAYISATTLDRIMGLPPTAPKRPKRG